MFTGLIEEKGRVRQLERESQWARIAVQASKVLGDLARGDSIAVNGVCLTVTDFDNNGFSAEVMAETLSRTSLASLGAGSWVNLERALAVGGRLGGHLVSGHVDGIGTITATRRQGLSTILSIQAPAELCRFITGKGSVAVDGVSLTVVQRSGQIFNVSLVSHTLRETTLGERLAGDKVNLEVDLIARYLAGLLEARETKGETGITESLLIENGFV